MKSLTIGIVIFLTMIAPKTFATTICFDRPELDKTILENQRLGLIVVDSEGHRLITTQVEIADTDSAPFKNVIVTYKDSSGSQVTQIHFIDGQPVTLVANEGDKEIDLIFNVEQTTAQGASCYNIGR